MKRFGWVAVLGFVVFIITVWMMVISPKQIAHPIEGDQRDPVLALEMVRNAGELTQVIGESRMEYGALREALDHVNRVDFIFMTAYAAFIAAFFSALAHQRGDRRWLLGSALAIIALLADMRENMTLLALTQDGVDTGSFIEALILSTWIKWFALGLAAAGAGWAIYNDPRVPYLRVVGGIVGASGLAFTIAAYWDPSRFPQQMALGIFLTWLIQVIYAYRVNQLDAVSGGVGGR